MAKTVTIYKQVKILNKLKLIINYRPRRLFENDGIKFKSGFRPDRFYLRSGDEEVEKEFLGQRKTRLNQDSISREK